jgi:hypothetical protein
MASASRLQQGGGLADPIGKGRAVEIDTFALEDLRLATADKAEDGSRTC